MTPGPWIAEIGNGIKPRIYGDGRLIAQVGNAEDFVLHWKRWEADARLIASAPDMLDALIQIRGFAKVLSDNNWQDMRLHILRQCDVLAA